MAFKPGGDLFSCDCSLFSLFYFSQFTDTSKELVHPQCPSWQHLERWLLLMSGWTGAVVQWHPAGWGNSLHLNIKVFIGDPEWVWPKSNCQGDLKSEILHRIVQMLSKRTAVEGSPHELISHVIHWILCRISSGKAGCFLVFFFLDSSVWVWSVPSCSCAINHWL